MFQPGARLPRLLVLLCIALVAACLLFYAASSESGDGGAGALFPATWRLPKDVSENGPYPVKADPVLALTNDPLPRVDFSLYAKRPPHNAEDTSGNAYALFYCTRDATLRDPYFAATQNIIYRLLWQFRTKHQVVVFVCPWVPRNIRTILKGQGAVVQEVGTWRVDGPLKVGRWQDVFAKLHLWNATKWKKLAFLDSDAFPMNNIDDVFDLVQERDCLDMSPDPEDPSARLSSEQCRYAFAGVITFGDFEINAGFLVFTTNAETYQSFVRDTQRTNLYDPGLMEQGFLSSPMAFGLNGSRPMQLLDPVWNMASPSKLPEQKQGAVDQIRVLHQKLWSWIVLNNEPSLMHLWDISWMAQCRFYDMKEFQLARETGYYRSDREAYEEAIREDAAKKAKAEALAATKAKGS